MKSNRIAALVLAAGAAVGLYRARPFLKPAPPTPGLSSPPAEAPPALPSNLPPLEESDEILRLRAGALSSEPAFHEWLKQESLIPRLTAAMNMIENGKVPRAIFAVFAPRGKFRTLKKGGKIFIDPSGFARYDGFAAMVQSVDAAAAARVFEELLPLFDAAQRALGEKNSSAREAFFASARELLQAPLLEGEVALEEKKKGIGWAFADERLENLSPAQKQLLRMGPKNQAAVQAKLRDVLTKVQNPFSP